MKLLMLCCIILETSLLCHSIKLTRCEFANKLLKLGFPKHTLPDWVCLAENESSLRTDEISRPKTDGSSNYGIFRVNSRYWCKSPDGPSEANGCNIKCDSLLLDDIIISARCAQKIYTQSKRGFKPWAGWAAKCQRRRLPNLTYCFLQPAFNYSSITF